MDSIFLKEKTRVENQIIYVYWWNFGKKTIDYQGSYAGYLKKKDIKVRIETKPAAGETKKKEIEVEATQPSFF